MDRRKADVLAAATGIGSASLLLAYGAVAGFGDAPLVKETALPYLLVVLLSLVAVGLAREGADVAPLWLLFAGPLFALGAFGQYLVTAGSGGVSGIGGSERWIDTSAPVSSGATRGRRPATWRPARSRRRSSSSRSGSSPG